LCLGGEKKKRVGRGESVTPRIARRGRGGGKGRKQGEGRKNHVYMREKGKKGGGDPSQSKMCFSDAGGKKKRGKKGRGGGGRGSTKSGRKVLGMSSCSKKREKKKEEGGGGKGVRSGRQLLAGMGLPTPSPQIFSSWGGKERGGEQNK